jgi:hypothetical protein
MRKIVLFVAALSLLVLGVPSQAAPKAAPGKGPCIDLTFPSASPIGTGSCPGVRPGALTLIPSEGVSCTLGFVYSDKTGKTYITTAGHCAAAEGKQHLWAAGKGPIAQDGNGKAFGRFVFASFKGIYDIGIIAVNKGVKVNAAMCHFGGPTGLSTNRSSGLATIEHYGNALGFGDVLPARTGLVLGMQDPNEIVALLASFKGDSGGPVVAGGSGRALGYVTSIGVGVNTVQGSIIAAPVFITRLAPQIALANKALKRTLKLRTASHSSATLALP